MVYKTIKEALSTEISVKRSRFIANISPCSNQKEAEAFIKKISSKYHDAKHNCYAYITKDHEKFSDDREPHGTAGKPIYDVLKYNNICNACIVVTRYFGGILLGTGGLTHAYSDSANEALKLAEKVEMQLCSFLKGEFEYKDMSLVQNLCNTMNLKLEEGEYGEKITAVVVAKKELEEDFLRKIEEKSCKKIKFEKIKEEFYFF